MKIDNCSVDQTGFLRTVELTESFCPRPARRQRTASIGPSWPARFYWPQRRQRKSRIARCAHVWVKIVCMSRCDVGTSLICHDDDRNLLSCLYVFTHHGFVVGGVKEYWFNYHRQYLCLGCVLHQMHLGGKPVRDLVVKHGHCVTSSQWSSLPANNKHCSTTLQKIHHLVPHCTACSSLMMCFLCRSRWQNWRPRPQGFSRVTRQGCSRFCWQFPDS